MSQSENKLMSIGEVAKLLGITRRMILNYEDKGLLQADKKEGATGNRYYTIDSLTRIRTIRILQNLGLSLDEIYAYYEGTTDLAPLITRLERLRDELNLNIERLKELAKTTTDFEIKTVTIPAQTIYTESKYTDTIAERTVVLREVTLNAVRKYGSDTSKRMFYIEYPLDNENQISYCVAIPSPNQGENIIQIPEEKALCIFYHGSYESIPAARDQIVAFAKENNIPLKGICRHIYLEGPPQHRDPAKFITQVALLIQ